MGGEKNSFCLAAAQSSIVHPSLLQEGIDRKHEAVDAKDMERMEAVTVHESMMKKH